MRGKLMVSGLVLAAAGCMVAAPAIYGAFTEYYDTVASLQEDFEGTSDEELESIGVRMRAHLPLGATGAAIALAGFVMFTMGWRAGLRRARRSSQWKDGHGTDT